MASTAADLLIPVLGPEPPIRIEAYDGSSLGQPDAAATVHIRSAEAFQRLARAPGELGLARAYATGAIDVDGDIMAVLDVRREVSDFRLGPRSLLAAVRLAWAAGLRRLPPLEEEARLSGRLHSKGRDAAAIAHHYDVGNDFYLLLLGPTMTYSCAVWEDEQTSLERAQEAKYELICRKLALRPGMRLLDIGCGWGGMVLHAARYHGVDAVGVTLSTAQADLAARRVDAGGLGERVEIRLQDYRDIDDGPFDAISSIGMYEHVGRARLTEYLGVVRSQLRPGGRFLNHGITRSDPSRTRIDPHGFIGRYIFPDGELLEVGQIVSAMQRAGIEARHDENLREHYARTLAAWRRNLEAGWDEAVGLAGESRARIWRLYLAGCEAGFTDAAIGIHQVLGVRLDRGRSGMDRRPDWDRRALTGAHTDHVQPSDPVASGG